MSEAEIALEHVRNRMVARYKRRLEQPEEPSRGNWLLVLCCAVGMGLCLAVGFLLS